MGDKQNLIIIGIIGINIWYLLDCSDGHLARYLEIKSNFGKFLDEIFGEIVLIFMWLAIAIGLFRYPDLSMDFISQNLGVLTFEYIIICGAISSISIPLRNGISGRFSSNFIIQNNNNIDPKNVTKDSSIYKWFKIIWTNIMGIGGFQGPLLILASITGYLGFIIIIYALFSIFYFIYLSFIFYNYGFKNNK